MTLSAEEGVAMLPRVLALTVAATRLVLLALPLTALLVLQVSRKSRESPQSEAASRALEALAVFVAVGMTWLSCLSPIALLSLGVVLAQSWINDHPKWVRVDGRVVSIIVYAWSIVAILTVFRADR